MQKNNMIEYDKDVIQGEVDLHIHSKHSDGSFTPQEIVERAHKLGLKAISITDHDNIDAIQIAKHLCEQYDIELIPGVEISAQYKNYEIHILGYFIDHLNKSLIEYIEYFKNERKKRAGKIVNRLEQVGIKIGLDSVKEKAYPGSIGRPHIADVILEQGYVSRYEEAFHKYLGNGCPCYVPKYKLTPAEAIKLINQASGISFIAHPGVDINEKGILELIKTGLEGIETVHPRHNVAQIKYFRKIIDKYHLLECGGSDCHGDRKKEPTLGKFTLPYYLVTHMKQWLAKNY